MELNQLYTTWRFIRTHALDDLHPRVAEIALVNAVEAGDVRIAGFLERGPVELSSRRDHAEVFCFVNHVHHMSAVPHHLGRER